MVTVPTRRSPRYSSGLIRWKQFTASLRCWPDRRADEDLRRLLGDEAQWRLVARLAAFDRRHLLDVHNRLVAAGHSDPELLRAALLHDIGKADERGRVGSPHRVVRVLLRRVSPRLSRRIVSISYGLFLAEHHAALGASLARDAGVSERCCTLIAQHEQRIATVKDPDLRALIAADEGMPIP